MKAKGDFIIKIGEMCEIRVFTAMTMGIPSSGIIIIIIISSSSSSSGGGESRE